MRGNASGVFIGVSLQYAFPLAAWRTRVVGALAASGREKPCRAPLADVRVLDASRVLAGPFCGQLLGDLGAEVIKVERPGSGDETRGWGPPFAGDQSAYYLSCNRNKKAVTLDLAQPEGLQLFYDLAKRSDVLLENFRAASADKLGLSPAKLHAQNPRLIVCSISGFGRTGPWSDLPGYDFAIQALSGLMSITGPVDGPPSKVGVAVTDVLTGLYAASADPGLPARPRAIGPRLCHRSRLARLRHRRPGQRRPSVSDKRRNAGPARQRPPTDCPYQAFATADDWLIVAVGNDGQWQRFCHAAERPDLARDERFPRTPLRVDAAAIVLVPIIESADAAVELCRMATPPRSPPKFRMRRCSTTPQLFALDQIEDRGMKTDGARSSGQCGGTRGLAVSFGGNRSAAGVDAAEIRGADGGGVAHGAGIGCGPNCAGFESNKWFERTSQLLTN